MGETLELIQAAKRSSSRSRRALVEGVVRIRCEGRRGLHTGFLRDLSVAGMFVRILDPELAGSRIDFDLDVESGGERRRISGRGEVVWCRASYEGPSRPPGMGVRFLSLEKSAHGILATLLGAEGDEEGPPLIEPIIPPSHAWPPVQAKSRGEEPPPVSRGGAFSGPLPWLGSLLIAGLVGALLIGLTPYGRDPDQPPARWGMAEGRGTPMSQAAASGRTSPRASQPWVEPRNLTESRALPAQGPVQSPPDLAPAELASDLSTDLRTGRAPEPVGEVAENGNALDGAIYLPPMTRLTAIRWEAVEEGTHLVLEGNGHLDSSRVHSSGIGGESPRRVLRLLGVEGDPERYGIATSELLRVRTGYHDGAGGELHVVLDLATSEITSSPPEPIERGLQLTLRASSLAAH